MSVPTVGGRVGAACLSVRQAAAGEELLKWLIKESRTSEELLLNDAASQVGTESPIGVSYSSKHPVTPLFCAEASGSVSLLIYS